MDKGREEEILRAVYTPLTDLRLIPSEAPDFILRSGTADVLGVEITEFYVDETEARARKIPGYMRSLIDGGSHRHLDDICRLRMEKMRYLKDGQEPGREIIGVVREVPSMEVRHQRLCEVLVEKASKFGSYSSRASATDLVIYDANGSFFHEDVRALYFPIAYGRARDLLLESQFNEVVLVTRRKDAADVSLSLIGMMLIEEVCIFVDRFLHHRKDDIDALTFIDLERPLAIFLSRRGFGASVLTSSRDSLSIAGGSIEFVLSSDGRIIRDHLGLAHLQPKAPEAKSLAQSADEENNAVAQLILAERGDLSCCVDISQNLPVDLSRRKET